MNLQLTRLTEEQFRANRFELVSRLADDLAHEIKNPLNAIVINLEVLKVRASKGDTGSIAERATVIAHEVRRLHLLIDRLLQLLRPVSDEAVSLALEQVLDEVLPLIEAQARLARNEFSADCATPVFVRVRRDLFKFALLNVLTAVHSLLGEGGGALTIQCQAEHARVRLTVAAEFAPGALAVPTDGAFERACDMAAALLAVFGGTLECSSARVALLLPRDSAV